MKSDPPSNLNADIYQVIGFTCNIVFLGIVYVFLPSKKTQQITYSRKLMTGQTLSVKLTFR